MKTKWKIIPNVGTENVIYFISDHGYVKSVNRKNNKTRIIAWTNPKKNRITPRNPHGEYFKVTLYSKYGRKKRYIHRLVATAYCQKDNPLKIQVDHIDGNIFNNVCTNLEWVTPSENMKRYNDNRKKQRQ